MTNEYNTKEDIYIIRLRESYHSQTNNNNILLIRNNIY